MITAQHIKQLYFEGKIFNMNGSFIQYSLASNQLQQT